MTDDRCASDGEILDLSAPGGEDSRTTVATDGNCQFAMRSLCGQSLGKGRETDGMIVQGGALFRACRRGALPLFLCRGKNDRD